MYVVRAWPGVYLPIYLVVGYWMTQDLKMFISTTYGVDNISHTSGIIIHRIYMYIQKT